MFRFHSLLLHISHSPQYISPISSFSSQNLYTLRDAPFPESPLAFLHSFQISQQRNPPSRFQ